MEHESQERKFLHIGEAAKLAGVTPKAVRHYHKIGLLAEPARSENGYRLYTATDLLRLQRIRRLRDLGLPLKRIKTVLGEPGGERTLESVLKTLLGEVSTEIENLEERRKSIEEILAEGPEKIEEQPGPSPTFELLERTLAEHLPGEASAEALEQEEKFWATLDAFDWPGDYRGMLETVARYYAERPEQLREMLAFNERMIALKDEPEDSPEVERAAEMYARVADSNPWSVELMEKSGWAQGPYGHVASELMSSNLSAAQLRLIRLLDKYFPEAQQGERRREE